MAAEEELQDSVAGRRGGIDGLRSRSLGSVFVRCAVTPGIDGADSRLGPARDVLLSKDASNTLSRQLQPCLPGPVSVSKSWHIHRIHVERFFFFFFLNLSPPLCLCKRVLAAHSGVVKATRRQISKKRRIQTENQRPEFLSLQVCSFLKKTNESSEFSFPKLQICSKRESWPVQHTFSASRSLDSSRVGQFAARTFRGTEDIPGGK